jgi:OOP family OmpA-OmpF porin
VTKFCDDKMPREELAACLQPNRRVVLEIGGLKPPKPAQEKPAQVAEQKPAPEQKPAAEQQAAKPKPKGKPQSVLVKLNVQGDSAFDAGSAVLKPGGRSEIDKLLKTAREGTKRDPRPLTINAVVISGHGDRLESDPDALSQARAQAVKGYLVSQGVSEDVIFWEGQGAKSPVPVTKFCDDKMPQEELAACLQPNRRVVLEIGGSKPPKPAKDSS